MIITIIMGEDNNNTGKKNWVIKNSGYTIGPLLLFWLGTLILILSNISFETSDVAIVLGKLSLISGLQTFIISLVYGFFKYDRSDTNVQVMLSIWVTTITSISLILLLSFLNGELRNYIVLTALNSFSLLILASVLLKSGAVDSEERWKTIFQVFEKRFSFYSMWLIAFIALTIYTAEEILIKFRNDGLSIEILVFGIVYLISLLVITVIVYLIGNFSKNIQRDDTRGLLSFIRFPRHLRFLGNDFKQVISKSFGLLIYFIVVVVIVLFFLSFFNQDQNYITFGILTIAITLSIGIIGYFFTE